MIKPDPSFKAPAHLVYVVTICDECGAGRLEIFESTKAPALSHRNYPPCGCGGEAFEHGAVVARRAMKVRWMCESST